MENYTPLNMQTHGILSNKTDDRGLKSEEQSQDVSMECKMVTPSSAKDSPKLQRKEFLEGLQALQITRISDPSLLKQEAEATREQP